jgi:hypothetical protein
VCYWKHATRERRDGKSSSATAEYVALIGDILVALNKAGAVVWTGIGAEAREAIHSIVDTTNEILFVNRR